MTSLKLAQSIAKFAQDKKAQDVMILDMRKVANFCDYFVIGTGQSTRQVQAIADGIGEGLKKQNIKIRHIQGLSDSHWVVLDSGSVVAHVFDKETREFYALEYLWQEAKKVKTIE